MDQELYKAAMHGSVNGLKKVVARWEKQHRGDTDADTRLGALGAASSEYVSQMLLWSKTPHGYTALHIAAEQGHAGFAAEVLALSDELLVCANSDGNTPLHLAARSGKLEAAKLLVDRAKAWRENSSQPQAPPQQPASYPDIAQAPDQAAARSPSPAAQAADQPAATARSPGDKERRTQGPLFMTNKEGDTPLHEAVKHRRTAVAAELLGAEPICAHALNARKESPLHIAAREGIADVVETIVRFPWVDVKLVPADSVSGTALHQAVLGGHTRVVEILLGMMSAEQVGQTASNDNNVLHYAVQKNKARVVKLLLEKNPDLAYGRNNKLQSPLHVAAKYGSTEAMREMLRRCPDAAEMVDSKGKNAFHAAIDSGKVDALRCLLRHVHPKEIVNRVDNDGNTPLHLAAKNSRIQSALLLIKDRRVNPCVLNTAGHTARGVIESRLANADEMDAYELYLWKQLKKHEASRCRKHLLPPVATYQSLRGGRPSSGSHNGDNFQHSVNTYTLVATLIATVTFAATFTMPGGYNQIEGTAIHGHRAAFKIFVISNTVAMCSAIVVVFCFIWAWRDPVKFKLDQLIWGHRLTIVACLAMVVSLMTAVYITVIPTTRWPAYVVIAIGASTPAIVFLILGKEAFYIPL